MAVKRVNKYEVAIAALLSEPTVKAAAAKCNMSYRTLLDWLNGKNADFAELYRREKKSLVEGVKAKIVQTAVDAAQVLNDAVLDETETPNARIPAISLSLKTALEVEAIDALEERLVELERDNSKHYTGSND